MIDSFFRFQGRLTRLQYLAASSCVSLLAGLLISVSFGALYYLRGHGPVPGIWVLAASPLAIPFLWAYLSLQAARLRDIGVKPFLIFAILVAINIVSTAVLWIAPEMFETTVSSVRKLANMAYGLAILFLPSDYRFNFSTITKFNPALTTIAPNQPTATPRNGSDAPVFGTRGSRR